MDLTKKLLHTILKIRGRWRVDTSCVAQFNQQSERTYNIIHWTLMNFRYMLKQGSHPTLKHN
jgi:hypothetical protein